MPAGSTHNGWRYDAANSRLDIYYRGERVAHWNASGMTVTAGNSITVTDTGLTITDGGITVVAGVTEIGDDLRFTLGNDNDQVFINRSASNLANTAITSVLIGTPVVPALAANSLIVSNVTASGDLVLAANNGGNSQAWFWVDASVPEAFLLAAGTKIARLNTATGFTLEDGTAVAFGTDADTVLLNRASALGANTGIATILVGTPVTPAIAANSLIFSNITADGDVLLATQTGGNSQAALFVDASANTTDLFQAGVRIARVSSAGLTLGLAGTTAGNLLVSGVTSGVVTIKGAAAAGTWTLTLPTAVGGAGQQLTDAGADGITSWAAAASLREVKDIGARATPDEALAAILATPVHRFHYKEGKGTLDTATEYVGVMADEAPWAMHYRGGIVNPVNTLGYSILGIQALHQRIADLERRLETVH